MWIKLIAIAFLLQVFVNGDIYMHNPRGSNNRLNEEGRERQNGNRLFDSQNNNRGGYNVGQTTRDNRLANQKALTYVEGSILPIEWTNQHSCGKEDNGEERNYNSHCELIIQYMCTNSLRDGTNTGTINNQNDKSRGMHEDQTYYNNCKNRARNQGLFTADQNLKGNAAINTRQNPNGNKNGFECPEERDYFPYWEASPWKDVAVLTTDIKRCPLYKKSNPKIDCKLAPASRDNHNGNGDNGFPNYYNWTLPAMTAGANNCALRMRYNISTSEIDWNLDASSNANNNNNNNNGKRGGGNNNNDDNPTKINAGAPMGISGACASGRGYMLQGNPVVRAFDNAGELKLELAVNTAQYGRTFQDRSHLFHIETRASAGVPANKDIYNLNVRGKRGNIVQVYPAVEYDFVPNRLEVPKGEFVHIQWTGSDRNPRNNDGQGTAGTDRSNMVMLNPESFAEGTKSISPKLKSGQLGASIPECLCNSTLLALPFKARNSLVVGEPPAKDDELNDGNVYFNMKPAMVDGTVGSLTYYMCTRNNNFSNRSQKGKIRVIKSARKREVDDAVEEVDAIEDAIMKVKDEFGMLTKHNK